MDARCYQRAQKIEKWIEELEPAEELLMNLESSEEAVWGELFLATKGLGSVEDRKAMTNSNPKMVELGKAINSAKVKVLRLRRMHSLAEKAGDWEYGTLKRIEGAIKRQGA